MSWLQALDWASSPGTVEDGTEGSPASVHQATTRPSNYCCQTWWGRRKPLPCPSFSLLFFEKHQERPLTHQGILLLCKPLKHAGKQEENTQKDLEDSQKEKHQRNKNIKEKKDRVANCRSPGFGVAGVTLICADLLRLV